MESVKKNQVESEGRKMTIKYFDDTRTKLKTIEKVINISFYYSDNIACVFYENDNGIRTIQDVKIESIYKVEG